MTNTNWLARMFDWLGEVFERFNPSAFRFLAAILPYLTPFPVAWLTADSASKFLHFPPEVAFTFVFCLEGIGLWFTALLVDSVVEWVRSKNIKTFAMVILFGIVVIVYVNILVSLNVTLEASFGNSDPILSRVITLLCFLPLLTGVGNGYYKLRLDYKTELELSRTHQEALERERRLEQSGERLEKYRIKHGKSSETFQSDVESSRKVSKQNGKFPESFYKLSSWRKIFPTLSRSDLESLANMSPSEMQDCATSVGKEYRTISNWRTSARELLEAENEQQ